MERYDQIGSRAVRCLEKAFAQLRAAEPDIPRAVVIVLLPASVRREEGTFTGSAWKFLTKQRTHEIAIHARLLESPPDLLAALLHEAAHAILYEKDPETRGGCSKHRHLKVFRDECLRLGLACNVRNEKVGFMDTHFPEDRAFPPRYQRVLKTLEEGWAQLSKGTAQKG